MGQWIRVTFMRGVYTISEANSARRPCTFLPLYNGGFCKLHQQGNVRTLHHTALARRGEASTVRRRGRR